MIAEPLPAHDARSATLPSINDGAAVRPSVLMVAFEYPATVFDDRLLTVVVLQGWEFARMQIPSKALEYLRTGRPDGHRRTTR